MMFPLFKKKTDGVHLKTQLFDLLAEMEKNLEFFYVMEQRQFITHGFLVEAWPRAKDADLIKKHESIKVYAQAMEDFNTSLNAYKDYEAWYTGDLKNKSPENAKKLHAMKHELDVKLKNMEAIIIPAGQDLEREMLQMGLLKQ